MALVGVHGLLDDVGDLQEIDAVLEEHRDGFFIGRVINGRHGAAGPTGTVAEGEPLKGLHIRILERKLHQCREIEPLVLLQCPTMRRIERVLDRDTHIRQTELRLHRAVDILYGRVHDGLRLHDHLDLVDRYVEEPARLEDLEALVDHRGGVDRDLPSHRPVRVLQRILLRLPAQLVPLLSAERSAGRREQDLLDGVMRLPGEGLPDGAVLGVDRLDLDATRRRERHDDVTGADEGLLVRERDLLMGLQRRDGRLDTDHADDGHHDLIAVLHGRELDQPVHPAQHLHREPVAPEALRLRFIIDADRLRMELLHLRLQLLDGTINRESGDLDLRIALDHIDGLGSDGTGRSQND